MSKLHHIIAATDLSPASLQAVDRGFDLASRADARYTLIHALGLDALGPLRNLLGDDAEIVAAKALQRQYEAMAAIAGDAARNRGVIAELKVEAGLAQFFVPAFAASVAADLVIVGAHGEGALRRLLLGSTASHLLRRSTCPVLIVKTPCSSHYTRALVAVDFSPASLAAIRMARKIACRADLLLHHTFDVPFEGMLQYAGVSQEVIHGYRAEARERALHRLHGLAAEAGLDRSHYTVMVEHGDAARHIADAQRRHGCDLLAMGKHGTHVTEELLIGSVTRHVLAECDVDTLVVVDPRPAALLPAGAEEEFV
ncbi:universal stress protein [Methyloversatilis thermotolerans]|uniref:universal stress protein n=1 Tax=Methyloversatilis thermotolerans TaxID=1346290 RepID=UPI00036249F3|nr:universal stress protein [Methyloversatilis thermotolerans]